jgi:hypothetical protein
MTNGNDRKGSLSSMLSKIRLCVDLNFEKRKEKANEIVGIDCLNLFS